MKTHDIIDIARSHLFSLKGHIFDLLTITKPISSDAALNLSKVISKLSPLLGNLIEFNTVKFLNDHNEYKDFGKWIRQDPGFPDTIFIGDIIPSPGFEIKAWFPLATEITARFKDSQNHFKEDQTYVCMLAWIPENIIYGRPCILGVCVISGLSVALARDNHYHNPPDYLVFEPQDTTKRTRNLQQTNTNGYKWQGTTAQFLEAQNIVKSWGKNGHLYKPTPEYQILLRRLTEKFPYRLDTNFAKMDRIAHHEIEEFKTKISGISFNGLTISQWLKLLNGENQAVVKKELKERLGIKEVDTVKILR